MKAIKEEWIEDVLNSMEGSKRAKPSPQLFNKITNKIHQNSIIPIQQWQMIAATALLILLNIVAVQEFSDKSIQNTSNQSIVSDYQLYE